MKVALIAFFLFSLESAFCVEYEFVVEEVWMIDTAIDGIDCCYENQYLMTTSDSEGICFYDYTTWTSTFIADAVDMPCGVCMLPESSEYLFCQNTGASSNLALCDSLGNVVWVPGNPAGTMGLGMSSDQNGCIWEIEINPTPNSGGTLHRMRLEGDLLITENSWNLSIDSPYGLAVAAGATDAAIFITDLNGDFIYYFELSSSELILVDEIPAPFDSSEGNLSMDISHSFSTSIFYWRVSIDSNEFLFRMSIQGAGSLEPLTWAGIKNSFFQ